MSHTFREKKTWKSQTTAQLFENLDIGGYAFRICRKWTTVNVGYVTGFWSCFVILSGKLALWANFWVLSFWMLSNWLECQFGMEIRGYMENCQTQNIFGILVFCWIKEWKLSKKERSDSPDQSVLMVIYILDAKSIFQKINRTVKNNNFRIIVYV